MEAVLEQARDAGFVAAAENAQKLIDRAGRLAKAYEHYRYVTSEQIRSFNLRLREATIFGYSYDTLMMVDAASYHAMPPQDVVEALKNAKCTGIFDTFEVAYIETLRVVADPILFGCITGCADRFFIAQWGDDVNFDQLVGVNGG